MKRLIAACSFVCLTVAMVGAVSPAPTNFAGTWVRDNTKSEGLPGPMAEATVTWVVTQDDKQLVLESKTVANGQERPAQKRIYNLDGSETTSEATGRMSGKYTNKAKWMDGGKILELDSVLKGSFNGNDFTATTKQHWELAEGGKVLKVHQTTEGPQGNQESKLVFNKK